MAGIFLLFYLFQLHFAKGLYLVKHLSIRGKHRNMNINITSRCTLLFAEDIKMKERNGSYLPLPSMLPRARPYIFIRQISLSYKIQNTSKK